MAKKKAEDVVAETVAADAVETVAADPVAAKVKIQISAVEGGVVPLPDVRRPLGELPPTEELKDGKEDFDEIFRRVWWKDGVPCGVRPSANGELLEVFPLRMR